MSKLKVQNVPNSQKERPCSNTVADFNVILTGFSWWCLYPSGSKKMKQIRNIFLLLYFNTSCDCFSAASNKTVLKFLALQAPLISEVANWRRKTLCKFWKVYIYICTNLWKDMFILNTPIQLKILACMLYALLTVDCGRQGQQGGWGMYGRVSRTQDSVWAVSSNTPQCAPYTAVHCSTAVHCMYTAV